MREWVKRVFIKLGVLVDHAEIVADVLVTADLMSISSNGVQRVGRYVGGIRRGNVNVKPSIRVLRDYGATALVDGDNCLGRPVALYAMRIAKNCITSISSEKKTCYASPSLELLCEE